MKKFLMACIVALMALAVTPVDAQNKRDRKSAGELVTAVFVTDIDCPHCAKKIEENLPNLCRGIEELSVDLPTKEVTVVYDSSKTTEERLLQGFSRLRVKAEKKRPVEQ